MDNIENVSDSVIIGVVVATFLLSTDRCVKALELCKECLILISMIDIDEQFLLLLNSIIYQRMYNAYCLMRDYTNAAKCGRNLLLLFRESGERTMEGNFALVFATVYKVQCKYSEAKELYKRAINIMIETGDRKGEALACGQCGVMSAYLGENIAAKEYLERALSIRIEIGDRKGKATDYLNLGNVLKSLCEYAKAKEYIEKALMINIEIGDRKTEGECYRGLGNVFQSLGEYAKAKECLEKALAIRMEIDDKEGEANDYGELGRLYVSVCEYAKAQEYLEKALAIRVETGDRRGEAYDYGNLGTIFQSLGEYAKAQEYHKKALAISVETGDREGEATDYGNLGTIFQSLGDYAKAQEYHKKALAIRVETGDREGEATDYGNLGTIFQSLGEYTKAQEYHTKSLAIRVEIGDRAGQAKDYVNLGTIFQFLGKYAKAEEYYKNALAITVEIGDRKGEAASYRNLGNVFQFLDEHAKAQEYIKKALAISMEIGDREEEVANYARLAVALQSVGEYEQALKYSEKALEIRVKIGDRAGEAADYRNLGTVFQSLGEYAKAQEYIEKALAIIVEIGDRDGEAESYGSLGSIFLTLGEYAKAQEYIEKALAIDAGTGYRKGEAEHYGNLGVVFKYLGEYGKSQENLEKALAINMEIGNRNGQAGCYGNLGSMLTFVGEYGKAQEYLEKALAISVEICDREGEAANYGNLGNVFQFLGEHVKAKEYYGKVLSICKDIGDGEKERCCYSNLFHLELAQGNRDEALNYLRQGISKSEELRVLIKDNDQFNISISDVHRFSYQNLRDFFCAAGKPNDALCVEELRRARALADLMAALYSLQNSKIPASPNLWIENVMEKERNCVCLYVAYRDKYLLFWILKGSGRIYFRKIQVDEDLPGAILVTSLDEFFSKNFRSFGVLPEKNCEDRFLNDSESRLKSSVEENLAALRLVEEDDEQSQDAKCALSLCYRVVIGPVIDLLKEPEIILVPDRSMNQVPFAALRDESGKYLSETFRIRMVPSLSTLKLIQDSPADYHGQTGALIVGDPKVGQVFYKGCLTSFGSLEFARKEAEMVGRLLGVQPLLGECATKQAVLDRINSVSLIHFAAHGNAERGEIALAPTVRSATRPPEDKDYLLTMSDISKVQLRAKLVVLSCCHSGRGQIRAEGVVGIARAFLGSGARSVLVALWALRDSATEQFMNRFYNHLAAGESASESLHEAMKWMRGHGFPNDADWAPFMLIGDNVTFDFGRGRMANEGDLE